MESNSVSGLWQNGRPRRECQPSELWSQRLEQRERHVGLPEMDRLLETEMCAGRPDVEVRIGRCQPPKRK
jgi:hypothetical protein